MNTQTTKPKESQAGKYLSWIIFLGVLARPLWSILRSAVGPSISSQQLLMILAGVVALGVVVVIAARARDSRPSTPSSPSYAPPPTPSPYTSTRPSPPTTRSTSDGMPRPPTFEPIITNKVIVAGLVVGTAIASTIVLILLMYA